MNCEFRSKKTQSFFFFFSTNSKKFHHTLRGKFARNGALSTISITKQMAVLLFLYTNSPIPFGVLCSSMHQNMFVVIYTHKVFYRQKIFNGPSINRRPTSFRNFATCRKLLTGLLHIKKPFKCRFESAFYKKSGF